MRNVDVMIRQHALILAVPVLELLAHIAELARNVAAGVVRLLEYARADGRSR